MSENFLTAKIPQALADKLGANGSNFAEKLTAFLAESDTKLAEAAKAATVTASAGDALAARLDSLEAQFASLKAAPAVDREDVLKAAKLEASQLVAAAIAKTGGTPLAAATEPAAAAGVPDNASPEDKWKADPKLQAEFSCAASYAAYTKAVAEGRVRIQSKTK